MSSLQIATFLRHISSISRHFWYQFYIKYVKIFLQLLNMYRTYRQNVQYAYKLGGTL